MNTQIKAAGLRMALARAGVNVAPKDTYYTGDASVLSLLAGMVNIPKFTVDNHDPELDIIQVTFDLLEEAYYEEPINKLDAEHAIPPLNTQAVLLRVFTEVKRIRASYFAEWDCPDYKDCAAIEQEVFLDACNNLDFEAEIWVDAGSCPRSWQVKVIAPDGGWCLYPVR